ncbi:MAG: hypothetical protein ABIR37_04505 [Candidatus Saccharimonadales bacterium]
MSKPVLLSSRPSRLLLAAISLTALASLLALLVWAMSNNWRLTHLSTYQVFPVLGLLAFSIMWSQYMIEAAKNLKPSLPDVGSYFRRTSWAVLILILFHPGLLIFQRFREGYGLPPGSYLSYVAPMQKWIVLLGTMSLLIFIAFEFKKFFEKHHLWHIVQILNDIAIIAIFYHGLRLGTQLQQGWFQWVWYFYGLTLVAALAYKYYIKIMNRQKITAA